MDARDHPAICTKVGEKGKITSVQDVLFTTAAVKLPFNKSQLAAAFNVDIFGSCHLLFLSDGRRCLSS